MKKSEPFKFPIELIYGTVAVQAIAILTKLMGRINWPWLWVLAPAWAGAAAIMVMVGIYFICIPQIRDEDDRSEL